jgi:hypothetical protein
MIMASIAKLGFDIADVKMLLVGEQGRNRTATRGFSVRIGPMRLITQDPARQRQSAREVTRADVKERHAIRLTPAQTPAHWRCLVYAADQSLLTLTRPRHPSDDPEESGIRAQRVPHRRCLEQHQFRIALGESAFDPCERLREVSQPEVDHRNRRGRNVRSPLARQQFVEDASRVIGAA